MLGSPADHGTRAAFNTADSPGKTRERKTTRLLPWFTLILCLCITALAWHASTKRTFTLRHEQFHAKALEIELHLRERMAIYEQVLHGVSGLMQASPGVTRSAFADYVRALQLQLSFPGLQGVGYAPWIPRRHLPYYEYQVQQEGYPGFRVFPDEPRDYYSSVHYIEPFVGSNRSAFGFDMFSQATRREAMERARDTGRVAMTRNTDLIRLDRSRNQAGFLMYMPIYRPGTPHATLEQRRENLKGWVYAPVWVSDLLDSIMVGKSAGMLFEVYDGNTTRPEHLLYRSGSEPATTDQVMTGLHTRVTLSLAQHQWTIYLGALPTLFDGMLDRTSRIVAVTGVALSLLLAGTVWLLAYGRQRALATARHMNRDLLRAQQDLQLAAKVFTHAREGIMITDAQGTIVRVNNTLCEISGYAENELIGQNPRMLNSGHQDQHFYERMWSALASQGYWQGQTWNRRKNGELYAQLLNVSAVRDDSGQITQYVGLSTDITPLKQQQTELEKMVHTDALTGLPNRVLLGDRLDQAVLRARRSGHSLAVVFIDLDGFKAINDRHGHDVGDHLLITVCARMQKALRNSDTLARLGGDEFVAVLENIHHANELDLMMNRLLEACSTEVTAENASGSLSLHVSASIGVALYKPHDHDDPDRLIRHADVAMYAAKQQGKNRYVVFDRHAFSDY
jgi:diguanylate cyclase (GGDEF)-like protein/PAS domain S-box-containing protein